MSVFRESLITRLILSLCCVLSYVASYAASAVDDGDDVSSPLSDSPVRLPDVRQRPVRGYYHFVTEQGDTAIMVVLNNITFYPPMRFKNKKQEEFYWRTVRDVKRALPYAKMIAETLLETYEYIETFPTQKEREDYLKQMEGEVFKQYKPQLKKFTRSQAKMLIKLINRETNQSSYSILKAFLGNFRAGFWQTFGHFFGVNLKSGYDPEHNSDDAIIERVCILVEQGML